MSYTCKSLSLVGFSEHGGAAALPMYCRRWQCPDCGKYHKRRLRKRLISGQPNAFVTLTTNPTRYPDPVDAFLNATHAINTLIKVLRRRYPRKRIEYAVVWEETKRGYPHAHILLRAPYIPQKFLSAQWERLSGAKIVDIRVVRNEGEAAAYVAKYLTKDPAVPPGYRRYRLSQGYSAPPPKGTLAANLGISTWLRSAADLPTTLANLAHQDYEMYELMPELYVSKPP